MTMEVVENICEIVGEVQKSAKAVNEEGDYFVRVRVKVDITMPLCRGRIITLENDEKKWVQFKYERKSSIPLVILI